MLKSKKVMITFNHLYPAGAESRELDVGRWQENIIVNEYFGGKRNEASGTI
jgi:hypothetical protein